MNRFQKMKLALMTKDPMTDFFIRNRSGLLDSDTDILDKSYSKSELVYVCVTTTARAISQVPLKLGRLDSDGEWEEVNQNMTPWYDILRRPNYLQDYYSFIEAIVSRLLLDGNVWIVEYPMDGGDPFSLWVLQKAHMSPLKDNQSGGLLGWNYRPGPGINIRLEMKDVAHVFFWNPYDPIIGFAPIDAGSLSIVTDYKAAKFNQVFFDQGASIGGVLSTEQGLTDAQYKRLKDEIDKKYSGYSEAHRMLILDGGLKFAQTSPSHKDMMFPEMRNLDKERILQIFGMKKAVISVTDDLNRATAWQQERSWWRSTNIPIMNMIAEALNFTFFEGQGLEARFDTSNVEALQNDFNDKVETAIKLVDMGFTANEINERLELGFDDKPWRDVFWIEQSKRPVGENIPIVEEPEVIEDPETPPQLEPPEEPEEDIVIPKKDLEEVPKEIELKVDFNKRGEKLWKDVVKKVKPIEKEYFSKTRKMFFKWRNSVLDWLYKQAEKSGKRKDESTPFILTSPLTDIDEMGVQPLEELKTSADNLYKKSMMVGLETIALEVGQGLDIDLLNLPAARAFLVNKQMELKGLLDTEARLLRETLSEGMSKRESLEQLAKRIRKDFDKAGKRAKTIARTEVYGSLNFGRNTTIRETNFTKVQWFTSLDERVRQTHSLLHGRTKYVNEMWVVGGSQLRFPADPIGAPGEVINCRCIEVIDLTSLSSADQEWPDMNEMEKIRKENNLRPMNLQRMRQTFKECF